MNNKINEKSADLNELYQQRKQHYRASASDKRRIMDSELLSTPWQKWFHRVGQIAIAASTLLLISLVAFEQYKLNKPDSAQEYTLVELHSLEEDAGSLSANMRHKYAQHYNAYLEQQQMFARHHKKSAVLSQFDNGWELQTCDQELVKISDELVEALHRMDTIEMSLKPGDLVDITFDKSGIILGIRRSNRAAMC